MNDYDFRLDAMLSDVLDAVLRDGVSMEDALNRYPQAVDELRPVLQVMMLTSRLKTPALPDDHVDDLEHRLISHMQTTFVPRTSSQRARILRFPSSRLGKLAATIAIVFLLVFGGGGAAVHASADTVPGDTLYVVKRIWESILLALSPLTGDADDLWLQFAQERLEEILILEQAGRLEADVLIDLYEASAKSIILADAETAPDVSKFAADTRTALRRIAPSSAHAALVHDVEALLEPVVASDGAFVPPSDTRPPSLNTLISPVTATATMTLSPTATLTPTASATSMETATFTPSPTNTSTARATRTPLVAPTETDTPMPTMPPTVPPSSTPVPSATLTPLPLPVRPTDVPQNTATDVPSSGGGNGGNGNGGTTSPDYTPPVRDTQLAVTLTRTITPPPTDAG